MSISGVPSNVTYFGNGIKNVGKAQSPKRVVNFQGNSDTLAKSSQDIKGMLTDHLSHEHSWSYDCCELKILPLKSVLEDLFTHADEIDQVGLFRSDDPWFGKPFSIQRGDLLYKINLSSKGEKIQVFHIENGKTTSSRIWKDEIGKDEKNQLEERLKNLASEYSEKTYGFGKNLDISSVVNKTVRDLLNNEIEWKEKKEGGRYTTLKNGIQLHLSRLFEDIRLEFIDVNKKQIQDNPTVTFEVEANKGPQKRLIETLNLQKQEKRLKDALSELQEKKKQLLQEASA